MQKQLNINTPEFWQKVQQEMSEVVTELYNLCHSKTFRIVWRNTTTKRELLNLATKFMNADEDDRFCNFFVDDEGILLFDYNKEALKICRENHKTIRIAFLNWCKALQNNPNYSCPVE
jgi:hypothetical protein